MPAMPEFAGAPCANGPAFTVVLGRSGMNRDDALRLSPGQFVPLDESADWPVDVYAAGRLVARGELMTLDGNFCVRVTEVVADEALPRAA